MKHIRNLDEEISILSVRAEQAESVAATTQAGKLLPKVKPKGPFKARWMMRPFLICCINILCTLNWYIYKTSTYRPFFKCSFCKSLHVHGLSLSSVYYSGCPKLG